MATLWLLTGTTVVCRKEKQNTEGAMPLKERQSHTIWQFKWKLYFAIKSNYSALRCTTNLTMNILAYTYSLPRLACRSENNETFNTAENLFQELGSLSLVLWISSLEYFTEILENSQPHLPIKMSDKGPSGCVGTKFTSDNNVTL